MLNAEEHFAYVRGLGDDMFAPDKGITRAEAAQMFYNLLKDKNVGITENFPDVAGGAWYAGAVEALASLNIITGLTDGSFQPERNITRAEFAAVAVRFIRVSPGDERFSDVPAAHWAYDYINTAASYGWINGTGAGIFEPDRGITRAEAVAIVNRMLERRPDKAFIDAHSELTRYTDTAKTHWAYYEIMEASNAHDFESVNGSERWMQ